MKRRIIGIPATNPLLEQSAYLSHELDYMLKHANSRVPGSTASELVHSLIIGGEKRAPHGIGEPCPICCMELAASESLEHCASQCGHLYHTDCVTQNALFCESEGKQLTCALCGARWLSDHHNTSDKITEISGYKNYGALTGQQRPRYSRPRSKSASERKRRVD